MLPKIVVVEQVLVDYFLFRFYFVDKMRFSSFSSSSSSGSRRWLIQCAQPKPGASFERVAGASDWKCTKWLE